MVWAINASVYGTVRPFRYDFHSTANKWLYVDFAVLYVPSHTIDLHFVLMTRTVCTASFRRFDSVDSFGELVKQKQRNVE